MRRRQSFPLAPGTPAWCTLHMAVTYSSVDFHVYHIFRSFKISRKQVCSVTHTSVSHRPRREFGAVACSRGAGAGGSWFALEESLASLVGSSLRKVRRVGLNRIGNPMYYQHVTITWSHRSHLNSPVWVCTKPGKLGVVGRGHSLTSNLGGAPQMQSFKENASNIYDIFLGIHPCAL